jgi:hypothetical protein
LTINHFSRFPAAPFGNSSRRSVFGCPVFVPSPLSLSHLCPSLCPTVVPLFVLPPLSLSRRLLSWSLSHCPHRCGLGSPLPRSVYCCPDRCRPDRCLAVSIGDPRCSVPAFPIGDSTTSLCIPLPHLVIHRAARCFAVLSLSRHPSLCLTVVPLFVLPPLSLSRRLLSWFTAAPIGVLLS